jgi:peptide deformylase
MGKNDKAQAKAAQKPAPLESLRTFGDPVLKQPTLPVTEFDDRLQKLAGLMFAVMDREEGVGLAAPQVGVRTRIMVWRHPERPDERYVFVNPRIVERSDAVKVDTEGCLSVPGCTVPVERAEEIVVEAEDLAGDELRMELAGLMARIVQHEVDHLEGRLILDRTTAEERRRVLKEFRERVLRVEP